MGVWGQNSKDFRLKLERFLHPNSVETKKQKRSSPTMGTVFLSESSDDKTKKSSPDIGTVIVPEWIEDKKKKRKKALHLELIRFLHPKSVEHFKICFRSFFESISEQKSVSKVLTTSYFPYSAF